MSNVHIRFDDIDHYEPSDSENEDERRLLEKNYRKTKETSDSEEEVFGLNQNETDSEEDDDNNELADSDVEGQEDDDELPNIRAWGRSKRDFYSTDYVDQDYGGFEGKDAQSAEFEEAEAKSIQIRLTEQLNDDDFMLNLFDQAAPKISENQSGGINEEIIKSDLTSLSKRELQQLLQKESPEMLFLIDDCKLKLSTIKYLEPVLRKLGQFEDTQICEFIKTLYDLVLNYVTNIFMYLLVKASKENAQKHPVLKRLFQYKKLIAELEPIFEEIVKPQIELILSMNEKIAQIKTRNNKKTIRKINKPIIDDDDESIEDEEENAELNETMEEEMDVDLENAKRAITYQIAKNKGLTPHRKKENRNPRVKHRNKFRKANIRRKGAVREVRTEVKRYGGEISGIKASVSKSIKLK